MGKAHPTMAHSAPCKVNKHPCCGFLDEALLEWFPPMLWILVSNRAGRERFLHREGPLEFGRGPQRDVPRKVLLDPAVSTNQLCLEELENDRLRLHNLSARVTVRLADGSLIEPGGEFCTVLPTRLHVGDTLIEIETADRAASAGGCGSAQDDCRPRGCRGRQPDSGTSTGHRPRPPKS